MKKTSLIFLVTIIIFIIFTVISLLKSNNISSPSTTTISSTPSEASSKCIITINGQKYDVTQFRSRHPGGDIFNCGTDMSTIFANQHPQNYLNKMKQYLVK